MTLNKQTFSPGPLVLVYAASQNYRQLHPLIWTASLVWHVRSDFRLLFFDPQDQLETDKMWELAYKWDIEGLVRLAPSEASLEETLAISDALLVNGKSLPDTIPLYLAHQAGAAIVIQYPLPLAFPHKGPGIHRVGTPRQAAGRLLSIIDLAAMGPRQR